MCNRHSFCLTRPAKVLDGCGLTESHTTIMDISGLTAEQHDKCNLYEWQPPKGWPDADYSGGLKVDKSTFETKQRHEQAIERHLRKRYPAAGSWSQLDVIRWPDLPLPDTARVQRAYQLALEAKPLHYVTDDVVLERVNHHLALLGCDVRATKVVNAASVRASVRDSVWASVWDSVWASVRDSVWDSVRASVRASVWASVQASVRASVDCSMVRDDEQNPFLPLSELAATGVYLYGVADDGTAYVWRAEEPNDEFGLRS